MTTGVFFDPQHDLKKFRTALGRFATGITIVTARTESGVKGITANSFASVSLQPALIMWSPDKKSKRHDLFVTADHFAVHVLASDQKSICNAFVKNADAFDNADYTMNENGVPILSNCLAVFECERYSTYDAGDHTLILGKVHAAMERHGDSLVFVHGQFSEVEHTNSVA